MASSTWLGSRDPLVQALPELAQMPACIQQQQKALALDALEAEVHVGGQPVHRVAVQRAVGDLTQSRDQLVPQLRQPGGVLVDVPAGLLQRRRQTA